MGVDPGRGSFVRIAERGVKNRQKVSKSFSTLFDNSRASSFFRPLLQSADKLGEEKTNKHKQFLGIVPGMGGGQICLCVAFFLEKKGNT